MYKFNVSLCLATPCDTFSLSFLLNVCTCLGVAGRQSIDYATSPTTLYSALFCSLFIIMYVVENKSLSLSLTYIYDLVLFNILFCYAILFISNLSLICKCIHNVKINFTEKP